MVDAVNFPGCTDCLVVALAFAGGSAVRGVGGGRSEGRPRTVACNDCLPIEDRGGGRATDKGCSDTGNGDCGLVSRLDEGLGSGRRDRRGMAEVFGVGALALGRSIPNF